MRIESLYRYPVKGLTPERLNQAALSPGRCIPWDRAFALAQGDGAFDAANPAWVSKSNFMCLLKNASITLLQTRFDEAAGLLGFTAPDGGAFEASPFSPEGQAAIARFLTYYLGDEARFGPAGRAPSFHYVEAHSFCDHQSQVVSLIGLGSLQALEQAAGAVRDKRRFRANLYVEDIEPWAEFNWLGREIAIGETRLAVQERIDRCGATTVNPDTGLRDANPVLELKRGFGHIELGVFAEVLVGGQIKPGDAVCVV
ncbi:MAG: sulfurase [Acidocella sp. 20-57-95]|nr:MAG: sulfurase [Acidocella sp. 20-57-95]OYV60783.1 MAG: sulfurase [Acidocella sp. 21-58-7]HQT64916.1 MOSC domain-containing protein [Acidocella sp.]HQU03828.1 MOSC domain-containing protein [Acidocella sp.]